MNKQINIDPSSIEGELKRQQRSIGLTKKKPVSLLRVEKGPQQFNKIMPQIKYGLGFSHQEVHDKIRNVSDGPGSEGVRNQGPGASAGAGGKFRKLGQTLMKRSNATPQPPATSSSDQSRGAMSSVPASKSKQSWGKGKTPAPGFICYNKCLKSIQKISL